MDNRTVLYVLTAMDAASVVTALTTVQFKQKKTCIAVPWTSCCSIVWNGGNKPSSKVEMAVGFSLHVVLMTMQTDSKRK